MWSGALPAILGYASRPWNGRALTRQERQAARDLYELYGPQTAFEWLSENAW